MVSYLRLFLFTFFLCIYKGSVYNFRIKEITKKMFINNVAICEINEKYFINDKDIIIAFILKLFGLFFIKRNTIIININFYLFNIF